MTDTVKPLAGVVVLELGASVAAPYAGLIMQMLGAQVIKVERSGVGDDARRWGSEQFQATSLWFHSLNGGKHSITVDLKDAADRSRLYALIDAEVDVVIQNMRPGLVNRLRLDAQTLMKRKPSLVYCNIGAFGAAGPLADKPGYDPLMQAFGGIMSVTGEPRRPPVRVGLSIVDMGTGMWCAIGILSALLQRRTSGSGSIVDTALFETALGWNNVNFSEPLNGGPAPTRQGSGVSGIVPYQAYACADGYLVVAGGNDRLFAKICDVLGQPQWRNDPRFESNTVRIKHRDVLNELLSAEFVKHERGYWQQRLDAAGVPASALQDLNEALAHPQTEALGMITQVTDHLRLMALPLSLNGERPQVTAPAPKLGEHNDDYFTLTDDHKIDWCRRIRRAHEECAIRNARSRAY